MSLSHLNFFSFSRRPFFDCPNCLLLSESCSNHPLVSPPESMYVLRFSLFTFFSVHPSVWGAKSPPSLNMSRSSASSCFLTFHAIISRRQSRCFVRASSALLANVVGAIRTRFFVAGTSFSPPNASSSQTRSFLSRLPQNRPLVHLTPCPSSSFLFPRTLRWHDGFGGGGESRAPYPFLFSSSGLAPWLTREDRALSLRQVFLLHTLTNVHTVPLTEIASNY